jgi:hypothetical protein
MNTSGVAITTVDQRTSERCTAFGTLSYQDAPDDRGWARWCSVSRDGACIHLGRYLRPGKHIMLRSHQTSPEVPTSEFKARVVWCRPIAAGAHFVAGLRIFHDHPESEQALAALAWPGSSVQW